MPGCQVQTSTGLPTHLPYIQVMIPSAAAWQLCQSFPFAPPNNLLQDKGMWICHLVVLHVGQPGRSLKRQLTVQSKRTAHSLATSELQHYLGAHIFLFISLELVPGLQPPSKVLFIVVGLRPSGRLVLAPARPWSRPRCKHIHAPKLRAARECVHACQSDQGSGMNHAVWAPSTFVGHQLSTRRRNNLSMQGGHVAECRAAYTKTACTPSLLCYQVF